MRGLYSRTEQSLWIRHALVVRPDKSILVLLQGRNSVKGLQQKLERIFGQLLPIRVCANERDITVASSDCCIVICAPQLFQDALESGISIPTFSTCVAFDFHALDAHYELVLTHFRQTALVRIVLLSFPLLDPAAAASWIGCPEDHLYDFGPQLRSNPLHTDIRAISSARAGAFLQTALKPAHELLKDEGRPAICVLSSGGTCRTAASTFRRQLATDLNPDSFVGDASVLESAAVLLGEQDELLDVMLHGITVCYEGMPLQTRRLMIRLFTSGASRLLITTPTSCLSNNLSASLMIVVGIQTPMVSEDGARRLADYDPVRLYQLQDLPTGEQPKFVIMCETHQEECSLAPLRNGLLLESHLAGSAPLLRLCLRAIQKDDKLQAASLMPLLSSTYLNSRVNANPGFYGFVGGRRHSNNLSRLADETLSKLRAMCCVRSRDDRWILTSLGERALEGRNILDDLLTLKEIPPAIAFSRLQARSLKSVRVSEESVKQMVSGDVKLRMHQTEATLDCR